VLAAHDEQILGQIAYRDLPSGSPSEEVQP
jgi:hypothetical protein